MATPWASSSTIAWMRFDWLDTLPVSGYLSGSVAQIILRVSGRPQISPVMFDSGDGASVARVEREVISA